jgi:hypothetical protein
MGGKITKSLVFYGLPGKNLGLIIATSLYRRTPFGARHVPLNPRSAHVTSWRF